MLCTYLLLIYNFSHGFERKCLPLIYCLQANMMRFDCEKPLIIGHLSEAGVEFGEDIIRSYVQGCLL